MTAAQTRSETVTNFALFESICRLSITAPLTLGQDNVGDLTSWTVENAHEAQRHRGHGWDRPPKECHGSFASCQRTNAVPFAQLTAHRQSGLESKKRSVPGRSSGQYSVVHDDWTLRTSLRQPARVSTMTYRHHHLVGR